MGQAGGTLTTQARLLSKGRGNDIGVLSEKCGTQLAEHGHAGFKAGLEHNAR